jgi:hypothetical protein
LLVRLRRYADVRLSLRTRFVASIVERPVELWPKRELLIHPTVRVNPKDLKEGVAVAQLTFCESAYSQEMAALRYRQMEQDIKEFVHARMFNGISVVPEQPARGARLYPLAFAGLVQLDSRYQLASCWILDQQTGDRWVAAVIASADSKLAIAELRALTDAAQAHIFTTGTRIAMPTGYAVHTQPTAKPQRFVRQESPLREVLNAVESKIFR